jgi:SNF-related kinase
VQEEEDDIADDQEPSSPLNRRGSRSEGRINITVQDRLSAELAERIKKEQQAIKANNTALKSKDEPDSKFKPVTKGLIDGIAGVKIIKSDDKERFLGQAGAGCRKEMRSSSVDKGPRRIPASDVKILTDSTTIPAINVTATIANQLSKPFKTMPSPTRPAAAMLANISANNNSCLKEIFEECDAGSSDNNSNNNTPRPMLRSQGTAGTAATATSHHRRTKFHKSRTTSCSSSDASDDDNNAEKKRAATKIIDCSISKQFTQRRDSDSSDSQDPGAAACSNGSASSSLILRNGSNLSNTTTTSNNKSPPQNQENRGGKTTSNSSEIGYRRHRTGRRRQTETRLRESQSLNRITEVQECEHNNNNNNNNNGNSKLGSEEQQEEEEEEEDDDDDDADQSESKANSNCSASNDSEKATMKISTMNQLNSGSKSPPPPPPPTSSSSVDKLNQNATTELKAKKNQNNTKAKGFSARFLQNLNFKRNHDPNSHAISKSNKSNRNSMPDVPYTGGACGKLSGGGNSFKTLQVPSHHNNDGGDRSKKIKILGRYFQVS